MLPLAIMRPQALRSQDCVKAGAIQHVPALLDSPNRVSALNITQHSVLISHGQLGNGHNNK